ncbi:MAG: OmpA family protein [Bacteroidetes bacterium]|nr:OmpA family protein [Bacteroidota bacterium]
MPLPKAIDADPEFADAYALQGYIAEKKKDGKTLTESFLKAIELCPEGDPGMYYKLGNFYFVTEKWKEAEDYFKKFLDFDKINEKDGADAELKITKAKILAHPVPFNPVVVKDISSADPEYLPYISPDNEFAFFTRRFDMKDRNMLTPTSVEKFMVARLQPNGNYDQGKPMDIPFNSGNTNNEGGPTITIDNKHLFFTVNKKGNFDICSSDFIDGKWTDIVNLGPAVNDPNSWESQPSISADGKTLYFVSDRDNHNIDIYKTVKGTDGSWTKAVKLGSNINTSGQEKTPFIHSDSHTLYFSSDSLPGLGGFDIFKCKMDSTGRWGKPVNLGYPINTDADEVGFFVSTDGKTGYYASNRLGTGGYDIYSFELYQEARPDKVYFQKGDLNGKENETPVAATIQIRDAVTSKMQHIDVDSISGEYAFVVNFDHDLLVSVKKEGYAYESKYVSKSDSENYKVQTNDIELKKLEVGGQYTIHDILFGTNSYDLNDTIKTVLDDFSEYMNVNPKLRVALNGHTDNVGKPADNMILSENRAKAVYNYLLSKGVDKSRLSYKGFGETKPIAPNSTEAGRAKNRRTVFVVASN